MRNAMMTAALIAVLASSASLQSAWAQPKAPAPAPAAGEAVVTYPVKPRDNLYTIAGQYFVSRDALVEVSKTNHLKNPALLPNGTMLQIPVRLLKTLPVEAVLGAYRGAVTLSAGGLPLPLTVGGPLREGTVISTAGNAFARVDMPDGTRLAVPSQSRVRISSLRKVLLTGGVIRAFTVEAGRSESTVTPLAGPADSYVVRTPVSVSAVRGTDFRVGYAPETKTASTGVVEGSVAVDASGASTLVPAKFGVSTAAGGLSPVPLLTPPKLQHSGRTQDGPRLLFDIDPIPGAKTYSAQLANDGGFLDLFTEASADAPHIEFDGLPDGTYFIRLTAIDGAGLEGLPSTYAVDRQFNSLKPGGAAASGTKRDKRFLFRWEAEGKGERTYRFQIAREGDAQPMIDEGGLKEPQITITNLPPGAYTWRVLSATVSASTIGTRYTEKWSAPQKFNIGSD
jgi:hypothetical protein